jgi:hypothetical protein
MSVQFYKILSVVLLLHVAVLSLVWVGFYVPLPRLQAAYIYEGALPAGTPVSTTGEAWAQEKSDQWALDRRGSTLAGHWEDLLKPSKPFNDDNLGF